MLNHLGILGIIIAFVLFALYIRFFMEIANYIGNKFRQLINFLITHLKNKRLYRK